MSTTQQEELANAAANIAWRRVDDLKAANERLLVKLAEAGVKLSEALAKIDRLNEEIDQLNEMGAMACQEPRDDCQCAGCLYAAEKGGS